MDLVFLIGKMVYLSINEGKMFVEYNQSQDYLMPPSMKEMLWEDHEAVILNEIIDELDLDFLKLQYVQEGRGRPAYNPVMLLKVLFYGYMNQTFSSRKLSKKLKTDIGFMYVWGKNQPDFRTISRFRKEKWVFLEEIFVQIVIKAKWLWIIEFGTASVDGTKIYASANKGKSYKASELKKKIKWYLEEWSRIDDMEDEEYWEDVVDSIPEELRTKAWRDKRRKELKEKEARLKQIQKEVEREVENKKKQWIKQERINLTDKDARLTQMKRKDWWVWYNPQNLTENQFIITTTVPNSAWDVNELIPILDKCKEKYGLLPSKQLWDKGYASEENYEYLKKAEIESYIPHQKLQYDIEDYRYNEEENRYEDKKWNVYVFKQNTRKAKWWKRGRPSKKLEEKEIRSTIYETVLKNWKKKYLEVNKNWQRLCKENDERLYSEEGKKLYKKRSGCVENVFGNIKRNLGFERFLLRWFEWVQIEWNLVSLAHNLKKLISFQLAS
jgi:transposase